MLPLHYRRHYCLWARDNVCVQACLSGPSAPRCEIATSTIDYFYALQFIFGSRKSQGTHGFCFLWGGRSAGLEKYPRFAMPRSEVRAIFLYPGTDTLSEWLRRWTRNPLGSAGKGSNPLGVALLARYVAEVWKPLP